MSGANFYDPPTREWVTREERDSRAASRKTTGERATHMACPVVWSDIPDYLSPIDNQPVRGRRERRYDLESNRCHEVGPNDWKGRNGGLYNDPTKAQAKGIKLDKIQAEQVADDPGKVNGVQPGDAKAPDPDYVRSAI